MCCAAVDKIEAGMVEEGFKRNDSRQKTKIHFQ